MKRLLCACVFLGLATMLQAQVVTSPSGLTFLHPDTDFAVTASYRLEFFQCASLVAGVCQGRAASPFQTVTSIPKTIVTGTSAPDTSCSPRFRRRIRCRRCHRHGLRSTLIAIETPRWGTGGRVHGAVIPTLFIRWAKSL
jgi:hypothetical protein